MRRNLSFQRAATLGFCSAHAVLFWRNSAFCSELMDVSCSPWGRASTPRKLHDHPVMKEGLQSGQKWAAEAEVQAPALLNPLHLLNTQAHVFSNPSPAQKPSACEDSTTLPHSPAGMNLVSSGNASYFNTADQTTSSSNKLFLSLGK